MHKSISDFLLDIVQNSIEAGASVITVDYLEHAGQLMICIGDNGKGMDEETMRKAQDPFYTDGEKHVKRKVGLGLPFLKQAVEAVSGEFELKSEVDFGTSVMITLNTGHIDCPPAGDLPATFLSMMMFPGDYDLLVHRRRDERSYRISRSDLADTLGGLESAGALALARQYLSSQEEDITHTEA